MRCLACNKMIRIKVNWQNLFREKNYFICDNCFIRFPIDITYQVVPMAKMIHVFSLFSTTHKIDPDAFLLELSGLFKFIKNKFNLNECAFFYFNTFTDFIESEYQFDYLEHIDEIIVMITYM